jgi:hypothetical protein
VRTVALSAAVRPSEVSPALGRQHAVELGDLQFGVADHRVFHLGALRLFDIGGPLAVAAHRIDAEADDLGVALGEFRLQPRHVTELGGADGREVFGMRKQNRPAVADPFVKVDRALRGFGGEIRGSIVDAGNSVGISVAVSVLIVSLLVNSICSTS